ncbi:MAG: hypothetical protein JWO96_848 [Candidatus Saccharibacteria bacterium]|nr:hypothetical protein [Candidatus Saccharibacteria bacterium]
MIKKQKGFHLLYLIILIAVVGLIIFIGMTVMHKSGGVGNILSSQPEGGGSGPNYKALASCSDQPFLDTVPTTLTDYDQIVPLGTINTPDHTQPTDHMYFAFKHPDQNSVTHPDLLAPGNIVITRIMHSGEKLKGVQMTDDYALTFSACKGVYFVFGHVQTLGGKLKEAVASKNLDSSCDRRQPAAGEETFYCMNDTDIKLSAGDLLGKVGGKPQLGAFDLGAHKNGYKDPGYVSSTYVTNMDAVCPLDFFTTSAKDQMYQLIQRTAAPRCGVIGQDKAGTLQGGWYAVKDPKQAEGDWNSHLSLVHNNLDPAVGILGVGGKITSPATYAFTPVHSGTINREPGETSAGTTYCYQFDNQSVRISNAGTGKILLQLTDNLNLKAEHKDGACTTGESFSNPINYYR